MSLPHLLVATGFQREAKAVAQPGVVTIAAGGDERLLETMLEARAADAIGIVSFGLAGALRDGLAIGDWVVATRLVGDTDMPTDPAWATAALARLPGAQAGIAYADGRMLADAAAKRMLGATSGAAIVDMESHVAARVARRHGLPFAVIRAVSDRVDHSLAPAITVSMRPGGGIDARAMARSILGNPGQIPGLIATGAHAARGLRALFDGNRILGPGLGFPDFGKLALDMP